jgi:hypothetical protein
MGNKIHANRRAIERAQTLARTTRVSKKTVINVGLWTTLDFDVTPRFRNQLETRSRTIRPRRRARF